MAEFTIFEGPKRGQWEVLDPRGHFLISEWVSKKGAQDIARNENKKLELKGRLWGLHLQLLVANLIPITRVSVEVVNGYITELFDYNEVSDLRRMEKDREFLIERIIAIIETP